jgi:hypothetical protein
VKKRIFSALVKTNTILEEIGLKSTLLVIKSKAFPPSLKLTPRYKVNSGNFLLIFYFIRKNYFDGLKKSEKCRKNLKFYP